MTDRWLLGAMFTLTLLLTSTIGAMIHARLVGIETTIQVLVVSQADILAKLAVYDLRIRGLEIERERRR